MALKVELKPFERIIIGQSVITNSDSRARFLIDGKAPILREKDILTAETANTPVKRLYLCVQMMYLKNDVPRYRTAYLGFVKELRVALPGSAAAIDVIDGHVSAGTLYRALKEVRQLMKVEEALSMSD